MRRLFFPSVFIALGLVSCNNNESLTIEGKDYSWILDSTKAKIDQGPNFLFIVDKRLKPMSVPGQITSTEAVDMATEHEAATKTLAGQRSFFVEFEKTEFETYLSNIENKYGTVKNFRVYFGVYPAGHLDPQGQPDAGRFSAMLVGVDSANKWERYDDKTPGLKMINIGTLCPTICPTSDAGSVYVLAGLPKQ